MQAVQTHKIMCKKEPAFHEMNPGTVYCYRVLELIVEYWEDVTSWPVKAHMPIYAWAAAVMAKDIVPLADVEEFENNACC